jgi:DNA polymerase-3 subunit delta'
MAATDEGGATRESIEPVAYPWHERHWSILARDRARLPHALLLHGQPGLGKRALALRLAQLMLCRRPTASSAQACGDCQGCMLFRAGSHPDLLRIEPQEDSSGILVDQVRGAIEFLALKAHTAAHKVVIIAPAEAMNVNAANSLLKILEEPPAGSLLVLVAGHLARVPVTIRSRCRRVPVSAPPSAEALAWLQARELPPAQAQTLLALAGGAPLTALRYAGEGVAEAQARLAQDLVALARRRAEPVACAERWKVSGTDVCLEWFHRFLGDIVRAQAAMLTNAHIAVQMPGGETFSLFIIELFDFIDRVSISRRQLGSGIDETLILEDLLIRWCEMTADATARTAKN